MQEKNDHRDDIEQHNEQYKDDHVDNDDIYQDAQPQQIQQQQPL